MSSSCGVSHESCRVCMCVRVCVRACVHACVRVCVEREPWYLEPVTSYLYVRGMARSSLLPITVYVSLLYVKTTVNVHTQRYSFTHINTPSNFHVWTHEITQTYTRTLTHTHAHTHTQPTYNTHTPTHQHTHKIFFLSHTQPRVCSSNHGTTRTRQRPETRSTTPLASTTHPPELSPSSPALDPSSSHGKLKILPPSF